LPDAEAIPARLATRFGVDVLVLAGSTADPGVLLAELQRSEPAYQMPAWQHYRFQVFTRFPANGSNGTGTTTA
jgi:hypothetical protein